MSNDPTRDTAVDTAELDRQDSERSQLQLFAQWLVANGLDFAEPRGNYDGPFLEVPYGVVSFKDGSPIAEPAFLKGAYDVLWNAYQKE